MKFLGRTNERKRLHTIIESNRQEVALLYGRRRVGKSALLKQVLSETKTPSLYYECKQTSERNNVESISALLAESLRLPPLAFNGIEPLLSYFFQRAEKTPSILVLDEYPYLRAAVPGLDSILQSLIDRYAESSKLHLILCGSFVDTMKSLLLAHNPLYGRISLAMELRPMDYFEAADFYPSFSAEDKICIYSVFGGIPYYNRLIDPEKSVTCNLLDLIVSPGARLENEVQFYLQSELSKFQNANEVFEALARGFYRYSDILSQSHLSSPVLSNVLKRLLQMEVVKKEIPINDPNNRKRSGYTISDPLSAFYYRYLHRYASQRQVMPPENFWNRYIANDFNASYVPHFFETICRQFLIRQNQHGRLSETFDLIGKYYYDLPAEHQNGEFDVVTKDRLGYAFYEAKFRKEPVTAAMIEHEIQQVNATGLHCHQYGFFSRSGFESTDRPDVVLYKLEDLYKS